MGCIPSIIAAHRVLCFYDEQRYKKEKIMSFEKSIRTSCFILGVFVLFFQGCTPRARTNIVDFKKSEWPGVISRAQGLSSPESWGTWSVADVVILEFNEPLPETFTVHFPAKAFGPNIGKEFVAHVGDSSVRFTLKEQREEKVLQFTNPKMLRTLSIDIPKPTSPKEFGESRDTRRLGMAFTKLWIEAR
jgi:phosphoglycerol transferase